MRKTQHKRPSCYSDKHAVGSPAPQLHSDSMASGAGPAGGSAPPAVFPPVCLSTPDARSFACSRCECRHWRHSWYGLSYPTGCTKAHALNLRA